MSKNMDVEKALDTISRMIEARAALKQLLREKYRSVIDPWKAAIKEAAERNHMDPVAAACEMAQFERDGMILIAILAAAWELLEEGAGCL